MEEQLGRGIMRVCVDMIDTSGIKCTGPSNDPVNVVPFGEQQFDEIGSILSGDTGNKCGVWHSEYRYVGKCMNVKMSDRPGSFHDCRNGFEQDFQIQPECPFINILKIKFHPFGKGNGTSSTHLP